MSSLRLLEMEMEMAVWIGIRKRGRRMMSVFFCGGGRF